MKKLDVESKRLDVESKRLDVKSMSLDVEIKRLDNEMTQLRIISSFSPEKLSSIVSQVNNTPIISDP